MVKGRLNDDGDIVMIQQHTVHPNNVQVTLRIECRDA